MRSTGQDDSSRAGSNPSSTSSLSSEPTATVPGIYWVGGDVPARPPLASNDGDTRSMRHKSLARYTLNESATSPLRGKGEVSDAVRLVLACDHRGFEGKHRLIPKLEDFNCQVIDLGCFDGLTACDYPDYAAPAARMVASGEADVAVLLDGSGIGMGIVANKICGVRAATCHDEFTARIAREHNHCNVLCVGTDLVGERALQRVVEIFLTTPFAGGRHVRRVAKLCEIESQQVPSRPQLRASS